MFQNETTPGTPPTRRWRAAPLLSSILGGIALGCFGVWNIDLFITYSAEARLQDAAEQTARRLAPRIDRSDLHDLQIAAETQFLEFAAGWPGPTPDISVTVIGSTLRVRALSWVGTHVLGLIAGSDISVDVSATASVPRLRHFWTDALPLPVDRNVA